MANPLISIIVPVYNSEKYIDKCLNSITHQTYNNIEIILVDDGSTDSSSAKCDEWAKRDSRIVVIHKKNEGVSKARNVGIDISKGEYISFVDSDDSLELEYIEELYCVIYTNSADMACCSFKIYYEKNDTFELINNTGELIEESNIEYMQRMFRNNMYYSPCWAKLFKKDIIGNTRFKQGFRIGEDNFFNYCILRKAKSVVYINKSLYIWLIGENNTTQQQNNIGSWTDNVKLYKEIFDIEPKDSPVYTDIANTFSKWLLDAYYQAVKYDVIDNYEAELDSILYENYNEFLHHISETKYKTRLLLLRRFKKLYYLIIKFKSGN